MILVKPDTVWGIAISSDRKHYTVIGLTDTTPMLEGWSIIDLCEILDRRKKPWKKRKKK